MSGKKFDTGKTRLDLIPPEAVEAIGQVLTFGAQKYQDHNWRKGIHYSRLYAATLRHMNSFWEGNDIDEESGLPALSHAIVDLIMILCTEGKYDDRYKKTKTNKTNKTT
jgi:hypothetical protein